MTDERRNDIGGKIKDGIILFLLTSFLIATWATASIGNEKASKLETRIAIVEDRFGNIADDLAEIKQILKRTSPFERRNE